MGLIFLGMIALAGIAVLPVLFFFDPRIAALCMAILAWVLVLACVCLPGLVPGDAGAWAPLMAALFVTSAVTTAGLAASVVTWGLPLLDPGFLIQTVAAGSVFWLTQSFSEHASGSAFPNAKDGRPFGGAAGGRSSSPRRSGPTWSPHRPTTES